MFLCICQQLKLHQVKKADKGSDCSHFQGGITPFSNMLMNSTERWVFSNCRGRFVIWKKSIENRTSVSLRKVQ